LTPFPTERLCLRFQALNLPLFLPEPRRLIVLLLKVNPSTAHNLVQLKLSHNPRNITNKSRLSVATLFLLVQAVTKKIALLGPEVMVEGRKLAHLLSPSLPTSSK
jgi:hypothetical protein